MSFILPASCRYPGLVFATAQHAHDRVVTPRLSRGSLAGSVTGLSRDAAAAAASLPCLHSRTAVPGPSRLRGPGRFLTCYCSESKARPDSGVWPSSFFASRITPS